MSLSVLVKRMKLARTVNNNIIQSIQNNCIGISTQTEGFAARMCCMVISGLKRV
jgi:hypothetical protein